MDLEDQILKEDLSKEPDSDEEGPRARPIGDPDDFTDDDSDGEGDGTGDGATATAGAGSGTGMPGAGPGGVPDTSLPTADDPIGGHHTGPKGVINDYREHKRKERIRVRWLACRQALAHAWPVEAQCARRPSEVYAVTRTAWLWHHK